MRMRLLNERGNSTFKPSIAWGIVLAAIVPFSTEVSFAEIIWAGDYSQGNFSQWHTRTEKDTVMFHLIPSYGRPIQYGGQPADHVGTGELLGLVARTERRVNGVFYPAGPTRGSEYSAKFRVKAARNGSEPTDCDVTGCDARRTELTMHRTLQDVYQGMPYRSERWVSVSHYVPADWDDSGSGWGPTVFQIKAKKESGSSPIFSISLKGTGWTINHRWSTEVAPKASEQPWQHQMYYSGDSDGRPYPRSDAWPDGLRDFPDVAASHAALQSVNKGGWTDWVLHIKFDERGSDKGGTGFLTLWKREGSGSWVKVLNITPHETTRGGLTFNHGIGFASVDGFGLVAGLYMAKGQVWGLRKDRVLYNANIRVADSRSTFSDLSHDGSSPGNAAQPQKRPLPPMLTAVE